MDIFNADTTRRIESLIRFGTIAKVDYFTQRAVVKTGNIETAPLPWLAFRVGKTRSWSSPDVGEQVVILSPSGDLDQGVILMGLYSNTAPTPSTDENEHFIQFPDGAVVSYNQATGLMTVANITDLIFKAKGNVLGEVGGNANLTIQGNADIQVAGDITAQGANISLTAQTIALNANSIALNAPNSSASGNLAVDGISRASDHISQGISGHNHTHTQNAGDHYGGGATTSPPK